MTLKKFREAVTMFEIAGVAKIPDFSDPRPEHQPGGRKYKPKETPTAQRSRESKEEK